MQLGLQVGGQQQYVPVSMVEPSGRQMLLANAVHTSWPAGSGRQMTLVPSWPTQHAIQQISESDWGRPLIAVDSTAILQVFTNLLITLNFFFLKKSISHSI